MSATDKNRRLPIAACSLFLALSLTWPAAVRGNLAAQRAPAISKPKPAPPSASTMPPLPPAIIDDTLAIGGDDIKAREVETRLTVEVRVNGRGPYQFVVDSGADTSVVVSDDAATDTAIGTDAAATDNAVTTEAGGEEATTTTVESEGGTTVVVEPTDGAQPATSTA